MGSQETLKITHLVGLLHALIKNISEQIRISIKIKKDTNMACSVPRRRIPYFTFPHNV